jgi:CHAT domain-containing protein
VVFATHGVLGNKVPGLMEPFLALTMAPPGTDGLLKMSDILSLKMNADVVALTACQSGLGKEQSGEGVMSMGRAFQYAGAKSVLMSLWEVEEKSAVTLAENFFRYRKEGKTKLDSLKSARDDIRNAGYKHPFFWSAFILVGESS